MLPKKITFYNDITRDIAFVEKVVLCYKCKTRHILGEICPIATPTLGNSGLPLTEQRDLPQENQLSDQSVPSGEINPSDIPRENKVAVAENSFVRVSLEGRSDSGSGSESDSTSTSDCNLSSIFF